MAGRKPGFRHTQRTREKIQATQLINRLFSGAMGEVELTPAQVNAAKTLLNKVLPDLSSVEMQATVEDVTNPTELSESDLIRIASSGSQGTTGTQGSEEESASVH